MKFKNAFLYALILSLVIIGAWEMYWRTQGKLPTLQNDKALWAEQRRKIHHFNHEGFILVGSSRLLFDIQLPVWEQQLGIKPIQLAMGGASPLPVFRDIVQNTNFNGTIILGVTPGLFFSTVSPQESPISGIQETIDYYHNQTFAQRINHWLSLPMQQNLVLMHQHEAMMDGNIDLKSWLKKVDLGTRTEHPKFPPFYEIGEIQRDRNTKMLARTATDTAFSNLIKTAFMFSEHIFEMVLPPDKEGTIAYFLEDLKTFKERGGKVILLRCPSSGDYLALENQRFTRSEYWDELVKRSQIPAYYFEDYPTLQNHELPDWSHLSATSAAQFTNAFVGILKSDGIISQNMNHSK
jgi:hypothetical protein